MDVSPRVGVDEDRHFSGEVEAPRSECDDLPVVGMWCRVCMYDYGLNCYEVN